MKTRLFYTTGKEDIIEINWDKPEPKANQIEVKNIMTGVCRSDIDMYTGVFQTLPKEIQGHEGLGEVTKVGCDISNIKEGDIVATRGEPSFADYYNADARTFVKVPKADPKYIIEPIACGVNIYNCAYSNFSWGSNIIILGTGFLAVAVYKTLRYKGLPNNVTVVGEANTQYWKKQDVNLYLKRASIPSSESFDVIFDLSNKTEYLEDLLPINDCAIIVLAAEKHPQAILPMDKLLWKAANIIFPSPRNKEFIIAMELAADMVEIGVIDTSSMWTKGYDRETEVKAAFEDGLNRTKGYLRGYIRW